MDSFSELSVSTELVTALAGRGITTPTAVQKAVIPLLLARESVVFQSETGTGKTFSYLLPAFMNCMTADLGQSPRILILAPTHELASQIKGEATTLAKAANLEVTAALCIGGAPLKRQLEMLKEKPDILVGGPARILELLRMKKLKTSGISMVVLDETDRMLAPEMRDTLRDLIALLPPDAQYAACSATMSAYHASILEKMLGGAKKADEKYRIKLVNLPPEDVLKRNIAHWALYSERRDKIETLRRFITAENPEKALVFTAVAGQVENIAAQLNHRKVPCSALYAKLDKIGRKKAIDDFRAGRSRILVTSDLSARGLDIPGVTHVIQLDVNENEDFFIHRAGRTARAGKSGINVVFGDEKELRALARIEKKLGIVIYPKELYGGKLQSPEAIPEDEDGVDENGR
jgi:superfamily II DNA/RNA helicase